MNVPRGKGGGDLLLTLTPQQQQQQQSGLSGLSAATGVGEPRKAGSSQSRGREGGSAPHALGDGHSSAPELPSSWKEAPEREVRLRGQPSAITATQASQ